MKNAQKKCKLCGKLFKASTAKQKYCCHKCGTTGANLKLSGWRAVVRQKNKTPAKVKELHPYFNEQEVVDDVSL